MTAPSVLIRMLLIDIIEDTGEVVISYASADEGMVFLEGSADQICLIVSDINMPGLLDGYDLSKIVTVRGPLLPMILTSGKVQRVLELGPNISFIAKPWTCEAMLNSVLCGLDKFKKFNLS